MTREEAELILEQAAKAKNSNNEHWAPLVEQAEAVLKESE